MAETRQKLIHLHSSTVRVPTADKLNYGEIAVQYASSEPCFYIKDSANNIIKFIDASAIDSKIQTQLSGLSGHVVTLVGSDNNKSVRTIASEEVAKIVADAPEDYNTLKEIADWIQGDPTGAAGMANRITALETASADTRISALEAVSGDIHTHSNKSVLDGISQEDVDAWDGAVSDLDTHTNNSEIHVEATDKTTWNTAAANLSAHTDNSDIHVTTADKTAWNGAVTTLGTHTADTTVHVAAGEKDTWNAKQDAFSNSGTLATITDAKVANWDSAATNNHKHANKDLLDTYTQLNSDLADAVSKKHNHANAEVLEGITSAKVTSWDNAATKSHTHENKTVLDGITTAETTNWNTAFNTVTAHTADTDSHVTTAQTANWDAAYASAHTHANNSVLDGITDTKVSQWDSAYTVSQNALVGIQTGKAQGVTVDSNKELDFTGIYVDCGEY